MCGTGWSPTVPTSGLRLAGYYAINALRLDKGYRAFGPELGPDRTPVEAGLTFTCDLSGDRAFVGRAVVERQRSGRPVPAARVVRRRRPAAPCSGAGSCCCATGNPSAR